MSPPQAVEADRVGVGTSVSLLAVRRLLCVYLYVYVRDEGGEEKPHLLKVILFVALTSLLCIHFIRSSSLFMKIAAPLATDSYKQRRCI